MWLAQQVVSKLKNKNLKIAFAESCTGGLLSAQITAVPGSSKIFDFGAVTYANSVKNEILGVSEETLSLYGAVSPQTAKEMAIGLKKLSKADVAVSVTGIAGPGGGTEEKPVGLVYVAYSFPQTIEVEKNIFAGSRKAIRKQTVEHVFKKMIDFLEGY